MVEVILVIAFSLLFLIAVEYVSRHRKISAEITRKFIHISGGTVAAFTPWFLSWHQIEVVAGALFLVMLASRLFHVFTAISSVKRTSLGDLLFAFSIGAVAVITNNHLIFMAAILHMSLADGLAAVIGTRYGKNNSYSIFGQRKSLIGSVTFLLCSTLILLSYLLASHALGDNFLILIWLPALLTSLEAVGIDGSDNVLVPLSVSLVLSRL